MKILWVKSGGLLPTDAGGKIRSFSIARELAKRHEVSLFTFYPGMTPDPHLELRDPFARVECLSLKIPERAGVHDILAYAANALTTRPYQMRKYCQPQVSRRLSEVMSESQHDVVLCDFLLTAGVMRWRQRVPTVIFTHNVEAMIWRRHFNIHANPLWKLVAWREYRTMERIERRYTSFADHVLSVSDEDRKFFLGFLPDDKVTTVPTGVDPDYFKPVAKSTSNNNIVFTGSMDWHANEEAVVYFCDQILPIIRQRVPDVTFWIVGRKPTRRVLALKELDPKVVVTGTVDDVRPYISEAKAYVVPLRVGSGTRIKIFEAMAMGKAIVSTTIGAEGLPVQNGQNILLADTPEEFARRTIDVMTQPQLEQKLGSAARALVENRYGWSSVTDVVDRVLQQVSSKN